MAEGSSSYNIVVLGGGSGGYACALRAAELGKRVALIEKDKVGGTCLHRGCIPTKALLHAAEIADQSRESAKFGIKTTFEGVEMPAVLAYQGSGWTGCGRACSPPSPAGRSTPSSATGSWSPPRRCGSAR